MKTREDTYKKEQDYQKKLKLLEDQRRKGQLGKLQKEWQQEQDKLLNG